nr:MAG TPA: hypothetical protein [Caudoviricetes sp.]
MFVVCNIFSLKVLSHETYSWLLFAILERIICAVLVYKMQYKRCGTVRN